MIGSRSYTETLAKLNLSLKMNGERCVFAAAGFLISAVAELFVLAEAQCQEGEGSDS